MARVNISIPDALYERLDRQRDRINASRVCASALEKELDMIEGRAAIADPEIAQLVQRLQTARERWYARGREDGRRWAVQSASRQEPYRAKEHLEGEDGAELAEMLRHRRERLRGIFGGFDFEAALSRWTREEPGGAEFRMTEDGEDEGGEDEDERAAFRRSDRPSRPDGGVDVAGYMEGWRDVVVEIWQVVAAALR
jgi:hypothetical protein